MQVFTGQTETMSLVIESKLTIGQHPDQAVMVMTRFFDDDASGQNAFFSHGHLTHPIHRQAIHPLCEQGWIHAEAGGEHLGKYDQMGLFSYGSDLSLNHLEIRSLIFPGKVCLNKGDQ